MTNYCTAQAKHLGEGRRFREMIRDAEAQKMQEGPHVLPDGFTISIPSLWFNENAATYWRYHGFEFKRKTWSWQRSAKTPYKKKTYSVKAWLESTRREFFSFWPQLTADRACSSCGELFAPKHKQQTACSTCEDIVQHPQEGDRDE